MFSRKFIYILVLFFFSCEDIEDLDLGILDGGIDVEIPITAFITSDGTIYDEQDIAIYWEALNDFALIFDYRLEYIDASIPSGWVNPHSWTESDTTSLATIEFRNLDDGEYRFYLNGRYDPQNIEIEKELTFWVDRYEGPAMRIFPLHQEARTGDEIDVYLFLEDVPEEKAVAGFHVEIECYSDVFEFIDGSYETNIAWLSQNSTQSPFASEVTPIVDNFITIPITVGVFESAMYGTGWIAKFRLRVVAQDGDHEININIDNSSFEGMNETIVFENPVNGSVTIIEGGE